MPPSSTIMFYGDPHGEFQPLKDAVKDYAPNAVVIVGDFELERPLSEELADFDYPTPTYWIAGNHDSDSIEAYQHLFNDRISASGNLHGAIKTVAGIKVAGISGVFRGKIWYPPQEPIYSSRDEFLAANPSVKFKGALHPKYDLSIYHEDLRGLHNSLQEQFPDADSPSVDILVTHEAPTSMGQKGFEVIDSIAQALHCNLIVHGHHHRSYKHILPNGISVIGLGKAEPVLLEV